MALKIRIKYNSPYKPYWRKLQTSRFVILHSNPIEKITNLEVCNFLITINRPAQTRNFHGPSSKVQWRPCRRHSCQNSGLLLWKTWVSNTCGPTFYNHFVLCGNFCDCRCNGAMTTPLLRQRNTEWFRVTNPTQCDSHFLHLDRPRLRRPCTLFFRCTRWLSTFHRGERPVFTRPSQSEREHDLSSKALSFSKERMRKRDRERVCVWELQWLERVVAHASVGYASSRSETCLHNLLPSWSKRARERDLFSTALSSSKERRWEGFNDGRE